MFTAYVAVAVMTVVSNTVAAIAALVRANWILENLSKYGVPQRWITPLGVAKAAGALGVLVGFAIPAIAVAAAVGLVLYFVGAVIFVARSRWYSHLPFPGLYLLLALGTLVLRFATL